MPRLVDRHRAVVEVEKLIRQAYDRHHAVVALAAKSRLAEMPVADVYTYARSVGMPHSRARLLADDLEERAANINAAVSKICESYDSQVRTLREVLSCEGAQP